MPEQPERLKACICMWCASTLLPAEKVWHTRSLYKGVSLCAPAIRMLVLCAWAWEDETEIRVGSETKPVLAIQAAIEREFTKNSSEIYPREGINAREFIDLGWKYDKERIIQDVIIDDDGWVTALRDSEIWATDNTFSKIIPADWPLSEDLARTEKERSELEARALESLKRNKQKKDASKV